MKTLISLAAAIAWSSATLFAMPAFADTLPPDPTPPTSVHMGVLSTGAIDGITDVAGVLVGHITRVEGTDVRDGATAILPNSDPWMNKVTAATYTINGNGALTNGDWVNESGRLETPIVLVGNTLDVGRAYDGVISAMVAQHPQIGLTDDVPLPVIAEIDGQRLNKAPLRVISAADVVRAIHRAHSGDFTRGSVGAGTPSTAYQYKAGIGSSSRVLPATFGNYTVGVLVNANCETRKHLIIAGVPVGSYLPKGDMPRADPQKFVDRGRAADGSIIIVVATDAPLTYLQLHELAKRTAIGLFRSGSVSRVSSGDQVIAFSTTRVARTGSTSGKLTASLRPEITSETTINALFIATADATESAIDNSLLAASTMSGNGSIVNAIPKDKLVQLLQHPPAIHTTGNVIVTPLP